MTDGLLIEQWDQVRKEVLRRWGHKIDARQLDQAGGKRQELYRLLRKNCQLDDKLAGRELDRIIEEVSAQPLDV